ncbi:MAG: hypothetical protein L3J66_07325 [Bacteroidales bacterium]|nr:hypothetical protein [Bacteroidales bacterium]
MKQIKLVFFFMLLTCFAPAQVVLTDGCKAAYNDILSLRFADARLHLQEEKTANPGNLYIVYLENYIDFLSLFIGENEDEFHRLEDNKSERIDQIGKLGNDSPYKKYMLGNIYLQWAVARLKFHEYFTAAFEINKAYRLLEANKREFPDFVPNNISLGILHIMIGLVPGKYHWVLNLISMEGNIEQGRAELSYVLQRSKTGSAYAYLRNETLFYLGFIELSINPDKKNSMALLRELDEVKQDNLLLSYLAIDILIRTGHNEKALEEFSLIGNRSGYFPFYYLDYLHGECLLRKLETDAARKKYALFLENFSGKNYLKDAERKKSWTYLLEGDTSKYFQSLRQILFVGNDDVDSDKQAVFEAQNKRMPDVKLLKARLLFDGGYYYKADSILDKIDPNDLTVEQNLERYYRKARIADESDYTERAKAAYLQTIKSGKGSHRYFAGNAALKLAGIYESEGNLERAEHFYRACLKMNFIEYETSIHTKAKTGLKRVTDKQD